MVSTMLLPPETSTFQSTGVRTSLSDNWLVACLRPERYACEGNDGGNTKNPVVGPVTT